ncbi:hypothetical protein RHMOL_Rhmol12G0108400 [Rhododendron molle]|uniref:Uncharacterized protein n=1 Tax=Rhododendron molle TaxID=49168 RepID=A0ACC0LGZ7_RHOML|nr:hypothetical protein RHMOL_Rhmol12G0108400 [Rhododendron molle]
MALSSRRKTGSILRSLSPTPSSSYSAFASSSSTFSSRSTAAAASFFHRPTSPSSQSVRFTLDCPTSPSRSISSIKTQSGRLMASSSAAAAAGSHNRKKQTCMCSPTTHFGSFRCSLHKNVNSHHTTRKMAIPGSFIPDILINVGKATITGISRNAGKK